MCVCVCVCVVVCGCGCWCGRGGGGGGSVGEEGRDLTVFKVRSVTMLTVAVCLFLEAASVLECRRSKKYSFRIKYSKSDRP